MMSKQKVSYSIGGFISCHGIPCAVTALSLHDDCGKMRVDITCAPISEKPKLRTIRVSELPHPCFVRYKSFQNNILSVVWYNDTYQLIGLGRILGDSIESIKSCCEYSATGQSNDWNSFEVEEK